MAAFAEMSTHSTYDVVIVGGAMTGLPAAWFLTESPDFDGRVLVIERDTTCEACPTARTNSCMRQQFSEELNVRISQFAAEWLSCGDYRALDPAPIDFERIVKNAPIVERAVI